MKWMDLHMHMEASEDSDASIGAMCAAAVKQGLSAIAVTDHVEMTLFRENGYDKTAEASWSAAEQAAVDWRGKLKVIRGIELGQPLYDLPTAEAVLAAHPYDFILGAQHKLGSHEDDIDYYFYDYDKHDVREAMDLYFDAVHKLVAWGKFHSLAHLTYPFRYIPIGKSPKGYGLWQDKIDCILRLLAEKGLALEINTSGLRNPNLRCTHPDLPIVRRFRELGGERITVGADAHRPEDVGAHIREGLKIAMEAGFQYTAAYLGGEPDMVKIEL